jgi:L-iditol 2-dehydrogenase
MTLMRAARFEPPGTIRIEEIPSPRRAPGEILLRVETCGLCGSDLAKVAYATAAPGEVLGHEVAGIVEEADAGARFAVGDRVVVAHHAPCFQCHYCAHGNFSMCRTFKSSRLAPGGFAERLVASAAHVTHTMFAVPPRLSLEAATFMEPLACALKSLPRLNLVPGDLALVYGLGPMGILFARLLAGHAGARVVGVDPVAERRRIAAASLAGAFAPDDPALAAFVRDQTEGRGADAVVLAAGRGALARDALGLVREGGVVCIFAASPTETSVALPLSVMYYSEVVLFGSYSPNPGGFSQALALLAEGTVAVEDLITHRLPLDETPRAFAMAMRGEGLKIMIRPGS